MRGTTAALFAAIAFSLGFSGQAFSAQPGTPSRLATVLPPNPYDSSNWDGDEVQMPRQGAARQDSLTSRNAPDGQGPAALPDDSSSVEVARELATRLNDENGQPVMASPDNYDAPTCCPQACCQPCCCCPYWTIGAGAIFLNQSRPGHSPIINRAATPDRVTPLGPPVLTANQFDPGTHFGFQLDVIRHNVGCSCWDLEARYFGINRWDSTVPMSAPATGAAIPFILPIRIATGGQPISAVYESLLQSVEFNARRSINPRLQFIGGLRYIAFDDNVGITVTPTVGPVRYSAINTRNNLIGPQIGANAFVWQGNRFGLQAFGKGGIYGNAASNNVSVTSNLNQHFADSANGGHTSFVGEIGLTGTYRLTNNWGIRTTFETLWLDGVALAPNQIAVSNPGLGTGSVASNSSLFYYGGFVGLEYYR
jgi:hypothetical protein